MQIKLAIIGSRDVTNYEFIKNAILNEFLPSEIKLVISGGAAGADKLGEVFAKEFNIPKLIFPAKWDDFSEPCILKYNRFNEPYNALAGFKRNKDIIDNCDVVIAFHKNRSKGTADSIGIAKKQGKRVIVIKI